MTRRSFLVLCGGLAVSPLRQERRAGRQVTAVVPETASRARVLRAVAGLPPEIVGVYRDPAAFARAASGQYFVFDRQGHTVYGVDAAMSGGWKIVQIGGEPGHIIDPTAFSLAPNGTFVVADRPAARERVQLFGSGGALLGGFTLPGRAAGTVALGGVVLNGVGSIQYDGRSVFLSQPETGALVAEYSLTGVVRRTFGTLRPTGHEADVDLHQALNTGLPLVNPRGGFYFVFQTGVPMFRKLDAGGRLVFERHIEGVEIDGIINNLPTSWPRRKTAGDRELPAVAPVIRTAAVDRAGALWVAFAGLPYLYVYDGSGEKRDVVQLRGAGLLRPAGLFFAQDGRLLVAPGCYVFDPGRGK